MLYYKKVEGHHVMTNVLITGGTGSLGSQLIPTFLAEGYFVTIISRDPHKQAIQQAKHPEVKYILADIRDREAMLRACEGQDIVIHAAALKRMERGDTDAREYHSVNVGGTLNVAEACRLAGVEKAIFISSDKAVEAVNLYGMTKAVGERIWLAENTPYRATKFSALRYGNVVESNGSVWHVWQRRIEQGLPLVVRTPEPTRFFLSLADAVGYVQFTIKHMQGGEIFVPASVKAFSLWELAREMQHQKYWEYAPLLATEKQDEILAAHTEYVEPVKGETLMWRIWPYRTPTVYETAQMFHSLEAQRLTGKEVIARLTHA